MRTLMLVLVVTMCAVGCSLEMGDSNGTKFVEAEAGEAGTGEDEYTPETIVELSEPIDSLNATVVGTKFSFDRPLPVVPSRRASGHRDFTITATITSDEVDKIVLHEFVIRRIGFLRPLFGLK